MANGIYSEQATAQSAAPSQDQPEKPSEDDETLRIGRERFDAAEKADKHNTDEQSEDLQFYAGDQWRPEDKNVRAADNRPCLTINQMGQYTRQITGDMRINRTSVKVSPVDKEEDAGKAETMQGLIRAIEVASFAQIAYVHAGKNSVICGQGAWRITNVYVSDDSFDQVLRIRKIGSAFAVRWDPGAMEYTREDANWVFVTSRIPRPDFKSAFPDAKVTDFKGYEGGPLYGTGNWIDNDSVRIAEYWVKKPVKKLLGLTPEGGVVNLTDNSPDEVKAMMEAKTLKRVRAVAGYKICQYLMSGAEILDGPNEWPGRYFPIIPVWGEEVNLGEQVKRFGMVRFSKDAQRAYNFHISQAAETAALSPRVPFIATVKQITGHEADWKRVNKESLPYLLYTPDGQSPPPQRQPGATTDVGNLQLAEAAAQNMQRAMGIYNASISAPAPETSGKAILARDRQADVGTFEYIDNLSISIAWSGRVLADLVPHFYDTERTVRILGADDKGKIVTLNKLMGMNKATGEPIYENDLSATNYDIVSETGPSFSTQRAEAVESLTEFMRVAPSAATLLLDIIAENMNWPGAERVAKRFKKMLPPGIDEDTPPEPPQPNPKDIAGAAKDAATAKKTEAEAQGVQLDNARKELELAIQTGQLRGVINDEVGRMILALLQGQNPTLPGMGGGAPMPQPGAMPGNGNPMPPGAM